MIPLSDLTQTWIKMILSHRMTQSQLKTIRKRQFYQLIKLLIPSFLMVEESMVMRLSMLKQLYGVSLLSLSEELWPLAKIQDPTRSISPHRMLSFLSSLELRSFQSVINWAETIFISFLIKWVAFTFQAIAKLLSMIITIKLASLISSPTYLTVTTISSNTSLFSWWETQSFPT